MNRILHVVGMGKRKFCLNWWEPSVATTSPGERPATAPTQCSFCGRSLSGEEPFTVWTRAGYRPTGAMCPLCIDTSAVYLTFARLFSIWYSVQPNYQPLRIQLMKKLLLECGWPELLEPLADLAIRLLTRQSAILGDCPFATCPKTHVELRTPKIALICRDIPSYFVSELFCRACHEVGLAARIGSPSDVVSGKSYRDLLEQQAMGVPGWAAFGVICCPQFVPADNTHCVLIYVLDNVNGLPHDVERIHLGGA